MKKFLFVGLAILSLILYGGQWTVGHASTVTLWATGDNDGTIHYHSYPPSWGGSWYDGWNTNSSPLSVYSAYYSPGWERDYSYVEIPIAALEGGTITSAELLLYSNGFGLGDYWYGSTNVYHLNPGGYSPTGDVSVDNPNYWGTDSAWTLFSTDVPGSGDPGLKSFNVTDAVLADLAVPGRAFSSFFIQASREVYGSVVAAETLGGGPRMQVQGTGFSPVPVPSALLLLGSGVFSLVWLRARFTRG